MSSKKIRKTIGLKMTLLFIMFALLFCVVLGFFAYRSSWQAYTDTYARKALQVSGATTLLIDGDRIGGYLNTMETDDYYDELQETLNNIKREFTLMYLYIFRPDDGDKFTYIMDAALESDDPEKLAELGDKDEFYDMNIDYDFFVNASEFEVKKLIIYDEYFGDAVLSFAPIYSSSGEKTAMVAVEISLKSVQEKQAAFFKTIVLLSCITTVFMIAGLMFISRRIISKPLRKLTNGALNFVSSDTLSSFDCNIKTGDEMQTLSEAFGKMACDLREYIDNLQIITAEKERIGAELDVATQIQASMLPCIFPPFPDRKEFNIYASMRPAKEVGGDFYDFFLVDENTLAVVIADVSGKGVPAALFMVIAKTLIKNNAQLGKSPREVFETVNDTLCENNEAGMFVTAFMGYVDLQTKKLTYVNARHDPALVKKSGGEYEFLTSKPSRLLAIFEGTPYPEQEIILSAGDAIYLYTDGVTEAMNNSRKLFSAQRLLAVLNENKNCNSEQLLAQIKREIDLFADGAEQADDITMLALEIN